jgi:hypothetical protein
MSSRGRRPSPEPERFLSKVDKTDTCWMWTGAVDSHGYGVFRVRVPRSLVGAHRWSYEHHVGAIPADLTIDHLCRVPACVNPSHLEAVTIQENIRRVPNPEACPHGHARTPENVRETTRANGWMSRKCRPCEVERSRRTRAQRRLAAAE